MPATAQGHRFKFAFAKQTAEGTAATTAEYQVPCFELSGDANQTRVRHEVADGSQYRPGGYIQSSLPQGRAIVASFPNSAGRLIKGHVGVDTISGAADPWTHTLTLATAAVPDWHTVWIAYPKTDGTFMWDRWEDCKFRALDVIWSSGQQTRLGVDFNAKNIVDEVTAPTVTTTNVLDNTENYHTWAGSTLKIDVDATPAATQVRFMKDWTIRAEYPNATFVPTDEVSGRYFDPGLWTLTFSGTGVLEDYQFYKATFFGSKTASNASLSATIVKGALDFLIPTNPVAANRTLQVQMPSTEFSMTTPPADVSGSHLTMSLTGEIAKPSSGEPFSAILKNAVSVAY